ncbi:Rrf2 family transcriptional regulator [Scytonema sp. UIC 10036]|uniref:RrF2 family transcriptional regulator n=1 Tax=Scytonema sp. UIC 10036 TaxID=2304196 RepID=UPI001FA9BD6B|nr:Rrf2 family transcriptional regulator [Scytonema sp. UIC 10036]
MMEISSKVKYTLLALLELTRYYKQEKFLQIEQIAVCQQIPDRYLGQLLMSLRRSGLVCSQRGVKGGYQLSKPPEEITVLEVLTCLEGAATQEYGEPGESLTMENMILKEVWHEATKAALTVFGSYTLKDLYEKQQASHLLNPMYYI